MAAEPVFGPNGAVINNPEMGEALRRDYENPSLAFRIPPSRAPSIKSEAALIIFGVIWVIFGISQEYRVLAALFSLYLLVQTALFCRKIARQIA
ncbi:MAG: hypothetical protein AAFX86_00430 [Pseudomonadota bacterium]